ncbi:hypothetical protein DFR30_0097 [Thiogranum longum]|uniref:Type 4 fimbrial biogenesis protein PilX N-terminal domain-containing protein n=1 Tax=Thiogranum longum TaxID=1537524 RepID=A0A4R1H6U0_9GAMM|nr:pilus assembly PilX N-terminal domain-containing protein [Thiogranum longum]TCK16878.1 hypothetical protein DFR30_0097 [Thiogranum longum]
MTRLPQHQRGAITLVGALFIVVVLSVMAISLLQMARSNILNSAVNNDAIEALFVAETGVEHASYLYASTSSCAGLAGVGPVAAGRGSFVLSNPVVQPGGECRVQVTASVVSAGTAPSVRSARVDLRLGLPTGAWAVGKNGAIFFWDGTSWTASSFTASDDLKAITCPTANVCHAVGKNGVVLHYIGGTWTETILDPGEDYEDIACAPSNPDYCFLVGKQGGGIIRFWDGSSWSAPSASTAIVDDLKAVTCPSTTCYAVGKKNQPPLVYNGSTWVNDGTDNINKELKGVSCYSTTGCQAVGKRNGSNYTFAQRPGGSFTWQRNQVASGFNKPDLESVYCISASDCWAAGKKRKPGNDFSLVHWDGTSWISWPTAALGKGEDLKGISCSSTIDCFAVGKKGSVLHWNGSTWSDASSGLTNPDLESVVFTGGSSGSSVALVRWEELIRN